MEVWKVKEGGNLSLVSSQEERIENRPGLPGPSRPLRHSLALLDAYLLEVSAESVGLCLCTV